MINADKKIWSKSQLEVINCDDDRILVSASAGSGKTTVMIERILRLIADGANIKNMLICTFTRSAASDMRARLYAEMSKRKMADSLKELANSDITTIDSFCQRLIKRYFYILGIDPQFEVLEESEAAAMKNEAVEQAIAECEDKNFIQIREILKSKRSDKRLKGAIASIINFSEINAAFPKYEYDREETFRRISDLLKTKKEKLVESINNISNIARFDYRDELLSVVDGNGKFNRHSAKEKESFFWPCFEYLKEEIKKYRDLCDKVVELKPQSESEQYVLSILNVAIAAADKYSVNKIGRSAVDFADLEKMALMILRSEAKDEIKKLYKFIFVDEYQDINPLQEQIIAAISDGGKLFMVGDLKQSIYAFRGCDPRIFKAKYDTYKSGSEGTVIDLDTNYRCSKEIVKFVNSIFSQIMTEECGGIDYKKTPMQAFKDNDGYVKLNIIHSGESKIAEGLYSVKEDDEDEIYSDVEAEAAVIVNRIIELIKKPGKEPVKFKDIAILTRGMGKLESLVIHKLREVNIPVSLKERAYYLLRPETGQLISFLKLINNRCDDQAMAISMLSPLGGFDEDDLAKIRLNNSGEFYECVLKEANSDLKVKDFVDKLDYYYEYSLIHSVDELADAIVSESGYFNYAFGMGDEAAAVLDMFLAFLGACPYKNNLSACLKFIERRNPYAEINGDENSINFMTVHKSKGLEFKYVFVIDLGKRFNLSDLYEHFIVGEGIFMNVYDNHKAYESDAKFLACEKENKKLIEEEMRILYVALTRAQEGLEIFGVVKSEDKTLAAYDVMTKVGENEVIPLNKCIVPIKWFKRHFFLAAKYDCDDIEIEKTDRRKILFGAADKERVRELKKYLSYKPQTIAPVKSYVTKLAHSDDEPIPIIFNDPSDGNTIERGNAYHRAMEKIDFLSPNLLEIEESDLKLIDIEKLLIAAYKMSKFEGEIYKEKPFMIKLPAAEAGIEGKGEVLIQGVVDLLIINGDEATIIDYKTGKAHGKFERGYFKQLDLYAMAVERLLGKRVIRKMLYYFDSDSFVEKT